MPAITLPACERYSFDGYFTQPDGEVLGNIFGERIRKKRCCFLNYNITKVYKIGKKVHKWLFFTLYIHNTIVSTS